MHTADIVEDIAHSMIGPAVLVLMLVEEPHTMEARCQTQKQRGIKQR
jgi:hypothetical protein